MGQAQGAAALLRNGYSSDFDRILCVAGAGLGTRLHFDAGRHQVYGVGVGVVHIDGMMTRKQVCIAAQQLTECDDRRRGHQCGKLNPRQGRDLQVMQETLAINNIARAAIFQPFARPMTCRGRDFPKLR